MRRYSSLNLVSRIYKAVGALLLIATIFGSIVIFLSGSNTRSSYYGSDNSGISLLAAVAVFVGGGITSIGIIATGELFQLLIDVQENTQRSAQIAQSASNDHQAAMKLNESILQELRLLNHHPRSTGTSIT